MDSQNTIVTEYAIRRANDGETIAWISPDQYDRLRTMKLLSPKFEFKATFPINLAKFQLGPNNLGGNVKVLVTVPGITASFTVLSVFVNHHMLKKPGVTMLEATLKGM